MATTTDEAASKSVSSLSEQSLFYDKRWEGRTCEVLSGIRLSRAVNILSEIAEMGLENPRILDLGCGAGVFSGILSCLGGVTGIDLSATAKNEGTKRFPGVEYLQGDAFSVALPNEHFDLVVLQEVIEHVEDQANLIDRCHDLLRPGGYFVVTTPNSRIAHASGKMAAAEKAGKLQPIENLLTVQQVRELISHRFHVSTCRTIVPAGHRGWLRVVNSPRLARFRGWRGVRSLLPVGLHTLVVAQKAQDR